MTRLRSCLFLIAVVFSSGALSAQTATTTTLAASPTTVTVGSPVALSATVKAASGSPSGTVTFLDGTTSLGTATLAAAAVNTPKTETLAQAGITIDSTATGTLVSADLNGDGKADLLSYSSTAFQVFLNNGSGGFTTKAVQTYALVQPAFADANGDGKTDIVSLGTASLSLLAGDGSGAFAAPQTIAGIAPQTPPSSGSYVGFPSNQFTSLAMASLSKGAGVSILVGERIYTTAGGGGTETGVVSVYTRGSGGFSYTGSYAAAGGTVQYPRSITEITMADVTGDGIADVLATADTRPTIGVMTVGILPSRGDGTLASLSATLSPNQGGPALYGACYFRCTLQPVVADFAHRGKVDIAFVAPALAYNAPTNISVFAGNGDGTFGAEKLVATVNPIPLSAQSGYIPRLAALDFDGDGNLDLIDSYGYAYLGDGKYGFQATGNLIGGATTYKDGCQNTAQTPCGVTQILPFDFNADGLTDLYLSRGGILLGQSGSSAALAPVTNFSAGTHSITAAYGGSSTFAVSTSQPVVVTVNPIATSLNITATPNPVTAGSNLVVSVTVVPVAAGTATGTVTFSNGTVVLGTATVVNNQASLTTTLTTVGSATLTATYSGDATYGTSTASVTLSAVQPFMVSTASGSTTMLSGNYGKPLSTGISLAAQNGYSGTVGLSCDGLPTGVSCAFSPASLTLSGSTAQTSTLTLTIGQTVGTLHRTPFGPGPQIMVAVLLGGIVLAGRRRKLAPLFALLVMGVIVTSITGCSSSSSAASTPISNAKTYNFRVLATAGGYQSATTYTLTVQ